MKSVVELVIRVPRQQLVALFADPGNMAKWMHDLTRYELISGDKGMPGSQYRMVPKAGTRQQEFISTIIERELPGRMALKLQSPMADVSVNTTFTALSEHETKLVSEETFTFHGWFNRMAGVLAGSAIRKHHREHMESFKRFAEGGGSRADAL